MNGPNRAGDSQGEGALADSRSIPPPFRETIQERVRAVDLVLLIGPAVLLVWVFSLPTALRYTLVFDPAQPSLRTAFSANYVHLTWLHLLSNVAGYLLLASVVYLLAVINGTRRRFQTVVMGILLVFPVPLSYLDLVLDLPGIVLGFSGLNMALLGYGIVEISVYIRNYVTDRFDVENAPGFFFATTTFVGAMYAETTVGFVFLGASALIALFYWIEILLSIEFLIVGSKQILDHPGYVELLAGGILLSAGFVLAAFPADPVYHSSVVNIYLHFAGFAMGFISTYTWVTLGRYVRSE
ncbi:hypothetical protein [Halospeciosus flavus]|uniref:Rhomboid family intramembrane serine protease n=2 Tax=Halospeciosus flavus TaxID=3032283 RepID=A0ABD5Z3E9_9EURY|nr:hypothetical protein [Halospeciosus flavus]